MSRDFDDFEPENDSQRGGAVFNRVCSAFIESVDEENGTISLSFEDFIGTRSVELSFDYICATGPGWFRFMPCIGDKVLLGFRPNNDVEILRYKAISYPELAERAREGNPPFVFRRLKSGEFEIMSKGSAEIWGSKLGKLHLAGGLSSIDLDRVSNSIVHSAAIHTVQAGDSEIRFGAVRRPNPFKTTEDASTLLGIPDREHRVTLYQTVAGIARKAYESTIGRVLDYVPGIPTGIFTKRLHPVTSQPLAADIQIFTADGIQSVRLRTDELGNTQLDLPATATEGFRMIMALGQVALEALKIKLSATTTAELSGTTEAKVSSSVVVNIVAPQVNLGANPIAPVALAIPMEARIAVLEATVNALGTSFLAHQHPALSPAPPPVFAPIVPAVTPVGSTTVKVTP